MIAPNEDERLIRVAVRDLLDHLQSDDLDTEEGISGLVRMQGRNDAHRNYLDKRAGESGYSSEVALQYAFDWRGCRVVLEGRADGIENTESGLIVEEVKSTLQTSGSMARMRVKARHALQCSIYCLMLAESGETV